MSAADIAVSIFVGVVGLIVAVGVALPIIRSKSNIATIDLMEKGLDARDKALADQASAHDSQIAALEARCRADTARLEGRVDALTVDFARELATSVGAQVAAAVVEQLQRKA